MKKITIAIVILVCTTIGVILLMNYHPATEFTDEEMEKGWNYYVNESERKEHNEIMDHFYSQADGHRY